MADVNIKYKGVTIAEMSTGESKTLVTKGKYCEDNITVDYSPRFKSYEITLPKSSNWVLLTALDAEVLEHINDSSLIVSLKNQDPYSYTFFGGNTFICGNDMIGWYNTAYKAYGLANRTAAETSTTVSPIFYPANSTDTDIALGGMGRFRVNEGKYYIRPADGFVYPGTYRLTFTW